MVKLIFHCTRQDKQNSSVGSQLGTAAKTAQQYSESYMVLALCLNDCLETVILRDNHHNPHQLLLEL